MENNVDVQVVLQARMGSTRLPGKILRPFVGEYTFLEWIVERLRSAKLVDRVVVASTTDPKDNAIEQLCVQRKYDYMRGSENDVLGRYADAIKLFPANIIVRVCSDEPLVDVPELDRLIAVLRDERLDYANNHPAGLPIGSGAEAFTAAAFTRVVAAATTPYEHEHVTPYFYQHPELFKQRDVAPLTSHPFASHVRLTLDTAEDLQFLRTLAAGLGLADPATQPTTNAILSFLATHPEIVDINRAIVAKTFASANGVPPPAA